jgi:NAD(P)-dependent dehydrogenase (short-subunit alcohol dehydrogenase family)
MPPTPRRWLVTGASSGIGRAVVEAAASRGDLVLATARRPQTIGDLVERFDGHVLSTALDVTDPGAVAVAVELAVARFGGVDTVFNNAGYGVLGALEELSEDQIRRQWETNVFGLINVTRAAIPVMRAGGGGHLLQMSSIAGITPWTGMSAYVASKHAVEGLSATIAAELEPFGIRVTIVEPGPFQTDFFSRSMDRSEPLEGYEGTVGATRETLATATEQPGDPNAAAAALLTVVDAPQPPLRLLLGAHALREARREYRERLAELDAWEDLALGADFPRR